MSLAATLRKTASKVGTFANNMVPSGSSFDTLNNKWILYPEPALSKITQSLDTIKKVHPDEIAEQTQTLIDQTKKVRENMAMLEPYLKQAADATKPLQAEGFCDYASAYKK